jgi:hypothetical protein
MNTVKRNTASTLVRNLGILMLTLTAMATNVWGQLPIPASSQFDVTGFIQEATLDPTCIANAHCGGTITINGHVITVPKETIVILPANALTWQEIFTQAPAPYGTFASGGPSTGLALNDAPTPLTTYEANVIGNRVLGVAPNEYIAGLIYISQRNAGWRETGRCHYGRARAVQRPPRPLRTDYDTGPAVYSGP